VVEKLRLNNQQVIVFNYFTCVITGSLVNDSFPINQQTIQLPWFPWACGMGAIFIALFNLIGFTAQKNGVAVASVANKLSLVVPFIFSLYLYNEAAGVLKIVGIVLALTAVALTCYAPSKQRSGNRDARILLVLMPILLFIGSGLLDTMIKYVEHTFLNADNKDEYLITAFAGAAFIGLILLIVQSIKSGKLPSGKAAIAGIALGIPNYFSIWCLLQVLKQYPENSSAIIPVNNMGVVLFSTVVAFLLFREKLLTVNWLGIILALVSIALIAFG
jgi:drug/metabolite transporter (DMT)-like permease